MGGGDVGGGGGAQWGTDPEHGGEAVGPSFQCCFTSTETVPDYYC